MELNNKIRRNKELTEESACRRRDSNPRGTQCPTTSVSIQGSQGFRGFAFSTQPASSSHLQPQEYQGQHPFRDRGISLDISSQSLIIRKP